MNVSVVIPNYNGSHTISKCIESVYNQGIDLCQVIVVDDRSTDASVELVTTAFPDVEVLCLSSNRGAAKARNEGLAAARGELLLFVDSDVYLSSHCLREMLMATVDSDIVYPRVLYEDGAVLSPASPNEERFIRRSPLFIVKTQSLERLDELFDEEYFIYFEDIDFFFRCYLACLQSKYVESALAFHSAVPQGRVLERRFYLETRNRAYCFLKFLRVPRKTRREFLLPDLSTLFETLVTMLTNRNIYRKYPDHAQDDCLSDSRAKLFLLFVRAIIWNVCKLPVSLRKQRAIGQLIHGRDIGET